MRVRLRRGPCHSPRPSSGARARCRIRPSPSTRSAYDDERDRHRRAHRRPRRAARGPRRARASSASRPRRRRETLCARSAPRSTCPPPATCASLAALARCAHAGATRRPAPAVELVDVGPVSLEVNGRETRLVPRQLPDVTDVVSGVVYARAADADALSRRQRATSFTSAGGPDVEPVRRLRRRAGRPGRRAHRGRGLRPAWSSRPVAPHRALVDARRDATTSLFVDVQPAASAARSDGERSAGASTARARARALPASLVRRGGHARRPPGPPRTARPRAGLESGEVRFDFSRSVAYLRR